MKVTDRITLLRGMLAQLPPGFTAHDLVSAYRGNKRGKPITLYVAVSHGYPPPDLDLTHGDVSRWRAWKDLLKSWSDNLPSEIKVVCWGPHFDVEVGTHQCWKPLWQALKIWF